MERENLLKNYHIKYIGSNVQRKSGLPLTLCELRNKLASRFKELASISLSTVSRWLRSDLNFSYKKLPTANVKLFNAESISKIIKWAWVINKLLGRELEVVFLDEFSISKGSLKTYGWGPKGKKSIWCLNNANFRMTIMAAFSQRRYFKIYGTSNTF